MTLSKILNKILYKIGSNVGNEYHSLTFYKNVSKLGNNVSINGKVTVVKNKGLTIGNNVAIGDNVFFECNAGVIIGSNVIIEEGVSIYSMIPYSINVNKKTSNQSYLPGSVIIESNTWIGRNSVIYPGVLIKSNSVLPPNSLIKEDVSPEDVPNFDQLSKKEENNISIIEKYNENPSEVVFIFSTGRSGSNAMEKLANKNPKNTAFHEPFYAQFKVLSFNYLTGRINREELKLSIKEIYSNALIAQKGKVYLESDQKLVPMIEILAEIFPKAKFIWLIRNPKSFLRSAKARGWFLNDNPQVISKTVLLQPKFTSDACRITGEFVENQVFNKWGNLSQEDKILWYWEYWNDLIGSQLKKISNEQFILKLEEINQKYIDFFKFINNEYDPKWTPEVTNKVKLKHKEKYNNNMENLNLKVYHIEKLHAKFRNLNQ